MLTDTPTSLWVPLYLALRCPASVTTDPNRPLQLLLEWLAPIAPPVVPNSPVPFLLLNNSMRYIANITGNGCTPEQVYWIMHNMINIPEHHT